MTKISKPIVFFGTEDFSLAALKGLVEAGYDIRAVITKPDSKKGRGQALSAPGVKSLAEQHDIPVWQPLRLADIKDDIAALGEAAGVLVSYGKIVPAAIIELFSPGIINLHPSLLPKYRGPSPIEAAILHGDNETGVSIMKLGADMDAGPVYHQAVWPLNGDETKPELYRQLAGFGTEELLKVLPAVLSDQLQPTNQNDTEASYCPLLQKSDGLLDPAATTAETAARQVRAYLGFPKTHLETQFGTIIITKAHAADTQTTPLDARCRDNRFLVIDELVAPSGKTMSAEAFLRGHVA